MILLYHKVYLESPTTWWVTIDDFYRQMCELKCRNVVYLDDYDIHNPTHVVIAFDGVYQNILQFAAPILKKFSYPFELFITGNYIGKNNSFDTSEPNVRFTSIDELKKLVMFGGRLQWHTKTHKSLNKYTNNSQIIKELTIPNKIHHLDSKGFKWLSYPYGCYSKNVIEIAKKYFVGALTSSGGTKTNKYQLTQLPVTNKTTFKKGSIGVIITSYNYGNFLIEAIESVLRQTRQVDEILISDDCSSDNTAEIAVSYQKKYPKLITFNKNQKNLGIVEHFRKAIKLTRSDYICILGADNRLRSDYIEKTSMILDADEKIGIAYTDFAFFGKYAHIIYNKFFKQWKGPIKENFCIIQFPNFNENTKKILYERNFIHGSSLFKRTSYNDVAGYKEKIDIPEDYHLFLRMVKKGWHAQRAPEPLLEYRQHSHDQANRQLVSSLELDFYKKELKFYRNLCLEKTTTNNISSIEKKEYLIAKKQLKDIYNSKTWQLLRLYESILKKIKSFIIHN